MEATTTPHRKQQADAVSASGGGRRLRNAAPWLAGLTCVLAVPVGLLLLVMVAHGQVLSKARVSAGPGFQPRVVLTEISPSRTHAIMVHFRIEQHPQLNSAIWRLRPNGEITLSK